MNESGLSRTIHVRPWNAPDKSRPETMAVDSDDFLVWWLPILGPTATLLAHRLARHASRLGPPTWPADELARAIGLGERTAGLHDAIARLERFGLLQRGHDRSTIAVRLTVPRPGTDRPHEGNPNIEEQP
jgi:hypothetical protein